MHTIASTLARLSDADLLHETRRLAARECEATAQLVASIAELDARRLYLGEGCSSLFTFCVERLHLSEHAAYHRIEAARATRRFPIVLDRLAEGAITLTAVGLLAPHLTEANCGELLNAAQHQSKRRVEELIARLRPRPDVPPSLRKLPAPRRADVSPATPASSVFDVPAAPLSTTVRGEPAATAPAPTPPSAPSLVTAPPRRSAVVAPLAPERYKLQLTMSAETHAKLRRAQDLLRHAVPDGDLATIVDRALTLLVADLEKRKLGATMRPRPPASGSPGRRRAAPVGDAARQNIHRRRLHPPARADGFDAQPATRDVATAAHGDNDTRDRRQPRATLRSRHIPAAIKRAVFVRDEGRCAFVGSTGRCRETGFLEFHHLVPYAVGGPTSVDGIELRCRSHNQHEARQFFGEMPVAETERGPHDRAPITPARSGPS